MHKKYPTPTANAGGLGLGTVKKPAANKGGSAVGKAAQQGDKGWGKMPKLKFRSLALLVVGVVLIPLSIGLGVSVFAVYVGLKWLGWWPFILRP